MKELLTIQITVENKMTWQQVINYYMPDWGDDQCSYYLWNHTCYPFSSETTLEQINKQLGTGVDLTDYSEI